MHVRGVPPDEEGLLLINGAVDEVERQFGDLIVYRLHTFLCQWTGVFNTAVGERVNDAARAGQDAFRQMARIIGVFWFFFRVEVIQVAEEFVKAVIAGQIFVLVAQMILAELARRIAERLQHFGDGRDLPP